MVPHVQTVSVTPTLQNGRLKSCDHLSTCRKNVRQDTTTFVIKILSKVGKEEMYLNVTKTIYENFTANILLSSEGLKAFPQRLGTRQGCPFSLLLFSMVLKVLARAIMHVTKKLGRKK